MRHSYLFKTPSQRLRQSLFKQNSATTKKEYLYIVVIESIGIPLFFYRFTPICNFLYLINDEHNAIPPFILL